MVTLCPWILGALGTIDVIASAEGWWHVRTPQWIKKLGGHAGELFVCAELSKRGIPNALLPENFSDDDIMVGDREASSGSNLTLGALA